MPQTMRDRLADVRGFTLIELLVVIVIIGVLAAIAIPVFLGQRGKAQDSSAKSAVRNAASAAESMRSEGGSYTGVSPSALRDAEASLNDAGDLAAAATGDGKGYTISAQSESGKYFALTRTSGGRSYRCSDDSTAPASCSASDW